MLCIAMSLPLLFFYYSEHLKLILQIGGITDVSDVNIFPIELNSRCPTTNILGFEYGKIILLKSNLNHNCQCLCVITIIVIERDNMNFDVILNYNMVYKYILKWNTIELIASILNLFLSTA